MPHAMTRTMRRLRRAGKGAGNAAVGAVAVGLLKGLRLIDPDRMGDAAGWTMRKIGPLLPEHRIGRDNLTAAVNQAI